MGRGISPIVRRLLPFALAASLFALPAIAQWQPVAPGVDHQRFTRERLDVHVVRIDLTEKSLRVIASEKSDAGLTVSEFAEKRDAIVAINGDYFDPQLRPVGRSAGACGVWAEGARVARRQGLVGVGRGRAAIQRSTMRVRRWMTGAVSGWPMLVDDCEVIDDLPGSDHFTRAPHPRTAAGISADGRTMFLVVADGRRADAPGLTLPELAEFMAKELGACEAMNLDGGGSSAMWIDDRIVNRPSDGSERKVANHIGVVPADAYSGCAEVGRKAKD